MTYSIVARDPDTGQLGVAIGSHWFGAGRQAIWGEAGVGVVATQAFMEVSYGPKGLALMRSGRSASEALDELLTADPGAAGRQVAMVDANGNVAAHSGPGCVAHAGHVLGDQASAQANMMERPTLWGSILSGYEAARDHPFVWRLYAAMAGAEADGGDVRGAPSFSVLVVGAERSDAPWDARLVDVRVDDMGTPDPLAELRRLIELDLAYDSVYTTLMRGPFFVPDVAPDAPEVEAALARLAEAQRVAGAEPTPSVWAAVLLAKVGRVDEARSMVQHALDLNPRWKQWIAAVAAAGMIDPDSPLLTL